MHKPSSVLALLLGAFTLTLAASAQGTGEHLGLTPHSSANAIDVAVTYAPERGKVAGTSCGCFWLQGGGAEAAYTFYRGLGAVASLSGAKASNLLGGNDVNKIDYLFGPRYTLGVRGNDDGKYATRLFGEALFGGVHALGGTFPATGGTVNSANAFAFQLGGVLDLSLTRLVGVRLVEASYYHSSLPNSGSNSQNDLKLGAGLTFRWHRR